MLTPAVRTPAHLQQLLADALTLLGPCAPLPALYEEVLRAWRGQSVNTARFRQMHEISAVIAAMPDGYSALAAVVEDLNAPLEMRLLAATFWAHLRPTHPPLALPDGQPADAVDPAWVPVTMACLPCPEAGAQYRTLLETLLAQHGNVQEPAGLPHPLPLLAFLHGLYNGTLTSTHFSFCVLRAHTLHPGISAHRPLHHLHRLLDYLGLSTDPEVVGLYRQLAAEVWPLARPENWAVWQWITVPGGPEIFPLAMQAVKQGEYTIMRFHELKFAVLPPPDALRAMLADTDLSLLTLLGWLRADLREALAVVRPELAAAVRWMISSNQAATTEAYSAPAWWDDWLYHGLPAARQVLRWLEEVPLPPVDGLDVMAWRQQWLQQHLVADYPQISANLLLPQAATGENIAAIRSLADSAHLPAIRALAVVPTMGEDIISLLRRLAQTSARPAQCAATAALEHIARRQGLPSAEELARQHLLAVAWEQGPLASERVRVGWQEGAYRMRLSLHAGKAQLDVIGPHGLTTAIPAELRQRAGYRAARAAQREANVQYRLFRQNLESSMLNGTPLSIGEFRYLLTNPVFAHLAERLLWRTTDGCVLRWAGPQCWETLEGEVVGLDDSRTHPTLTLSLVHPVELDGAGVLGRWQSLAADHRLMQPFKQLFREIYTLGSTGGMQCERFAGRRIDPRRAYALLRSAGFAPGNGEARCEWPHGITAHLCWADGAVGRDLFGPHRKAEVTTGHIWFTQAGETLPLDAVDAIVFSETLRAADLLTTRAAVGEAEMTSRETVALRALLLREVARSFRLTNIAVPEDGRFALVLGTRATYRVNLTSGTVMLEPEGRQILVPTHDPRWRPVEDGDTTSEILAITLTLAHDEEMDDLTFLAQL